MKVNVSYIDQEINKQWLVPYNPYMSHQFNCHMNVELCMSVKAIRYVLKYVHWRCDKNVFALQNSENQSRDEISEFKTARYVGANDPVWRILEFPMHNRYPPVVHLAVYLENYQHVYYTVYQSIIRAMAEPPKTTLTEFFIFKTKLFYFHVPMFYIWNVIGKKGLKRGTETDNVDVKQTDVIDRVYTINPKQ
ncbi:uncharacterized protein LOC106458967 [Limulus polyphemus]|uniref:Uncharacterized protein LOC106458967 n=1 Tax=Limulus polyphemus TaxID=6850 RepID=A0ABM1B3E2_LIMPO|nr:uncharacterized protein LOC106458967 [Limulus polyphemus]